MERVANLLRAEERAAGAEHGLLPVHLHTLCYLYRCNRYSDTPAGVTEYLGITKGTASQTLHVLRRKMLIIACKDPSDKRVTHLILSVLGKNVLENCFPPPLFRGLPPLSELEGLENRLETLLIALQRANDRKPFGVCRTCVHFHRVGKGQGDYQCGLTLEPLSEDDSTRICREHALSEGA